KLRKQMRIELKALQARVGTTFLFVTHDQEEALSMSDSIAVMNAGRIEQIGTPEDVYLRPTTRFVAGFLGAVNWIDGFGLRPEALRLARTAPVSEACRAATVLRSVFRGNRLQVHVRLAAGAEAVAATALCLLLGFPLALFISRAQKWRGLYLFLVILPFWTSFLVRTYAWMFLLRDTGLLNTLLQRLGAIREPLPLLYNNGAVLLGLVYGYLP